MSYLQISRPSGLKPLLLFFFLLGVILLALNHLISLGLRKIHTSNIGAVNKFMQGQCETDILVCGSSRALVHYDPAMIEKATGHRAYNIGRNGGHIDVQVFTLHAFLARNSHPKLIILNLDIHSLLPSEELLFSDILPFVPYLNEPDIEEGLAEINPHVWKWRYIPLYAYVVEDMNFQWMAGLLANFHISPREDYYLGFNGRDWKWSSEFDNFARRHPLGIKARQEQRGVERFRAFLSTVNSNGIPMVLVYSPEYIGAQRLVQNRPEIIEKMRSIAAEFSVPLWDFSDSPLCQDTAYFYNSEHLNRTGAKKFSEDLSARLNAEVFKTDHPRGAMPYVHASSSHLLN
jgi:hypothetical protein